MAPIDWVEEYKEWLFDYIRVGDKCERYSRLLDFLSCWVFNWTIDHDENRAADGLSLRDNFAADHGCDEFFWEGRLPPECTVLEMMIALAIRCEDVIFDPEEGTRIHCWFWEMIDSLGFGNMTDRRFSLDEADKIVRRFLNREYELDGSGGLFQVKNSHVDMRKCEIWYQMHAWIMENFTF